MHEAKFHSRWLRESTEGKGEEVEEMGKRTKEEEIKSGRRVFQAKWKGSRWTVNVRVFLFLSRG